MENIDENNKFFTSTKIIIIVSIIILIFGGFFYYYKYKNKNNNKSQQALQNQVTIIPLSILIKGATTNSYNVKVTSTMLEEISLYKFINKYFLISDNKYINLISLNNQTKYDSNGNRLIALDPGVRKFLVGYDPSGLSIFFGDKASHRLSRMLRDIDKNPGYLKWKKIRNLVTELHWKVISFLISNYNVILLPDFRVSEMVRGKKLNRMTKRLLMMFSFHMFRTRLEYKCKRHKKDLIIVDESYTSCTCTGCFQISKIGSRESYKCENCGLEVDRDVGGSRNILIKNINLRSG